MLFEGLPAELPFRSSPVSRPSCFASVIGHRQGAELCFRRDNGAVRKLANRDLTPFDQVVGSPDWTSDKAGNRLNAPQRIEFDVIDFQHGVLLLNTMQMCRDRQQTAPKKRYEF